MTTTYRAAAKPYRALVSALVIAMTALGLVAVSTVAATPAQAFEQQYIYWANGGSFSAPGTIGRAKLDGTDVQQDFITGLDTPSGVYVAFGYIYWADVIADTIGRAKLDGTDVEPNFITGIDLADGVAVDTNYIYFTRNQGTYIGRANLDGTGVDQTFITGLDRTTGVIKLAHGKIYWGDYDGYIGVADIDGSNVNKTFIPVTGFAEGLVVTANKIYFGNSDTTTGVPSDVDSTIGIADLDGQNVNENYITAAAPYIYGLTSDGTNLYWASKQYGVYPEPLTTIGTSAMNGSGLNLDFITGAHSPNGVAIGSEYFLANPVPPDAPTAIAGTPGSGNAAISFTAGADNGCTITNYAYKLGTGSWTPLNPADTTTPITIPGLAVGTTYEAQIRALCGSTSGTPSEAFSIVMPPGTPAAPTSLSAAPGNGSAEITFTPGDPKGRTITNYEYSTDNGTTWIPLEEPQTTSPVTVPLAKGESHDVLLRAIYSGGAGDASAPLTIVIPATAPAAPDQPQATSGSREAVVSWTAPTDNGGSEITQYVVTVDGHPGLGCILNPVVEPLQCTVTGLAPGTSYRFSVAAVNNVGTSTSSELSEAVSTPVELTPPSDPSSPTGPSDKPAKLALPMVVKAKSNKFRPVRKGKTVLVAGASTAAGATIRSTVTCQSKARGDLVFCTHKVSKNGKVVVQTHGVRNVQITVRQRAVPAAGSSYKPSEIFKRTWLVR